MMSVAASALCLHLGSPEPSSTTTAAVTRLFPNPVESTMIAGVPAPLVIFASDGLTVHV
jgi:hypothetical protein